MKNFKNYLDKLEEINVSYIENMFKDIDFNLRIFYENCILDYITKNKTFIDCDDKKLYKTLMNINCGWWTFFRGICDIYEGFSSIGDSDLDCYKEWCNCNDYDVLKEIVKFFNWFYDAFINEFCGDAKTYNFLCRLSGIVEDGDFFGRMKDFEILNDIVKERRGY